MGRAPARAASAKYVYSETELRVAIMESYEAGLPIEGIFDPANARWAGRVIVIDGPITITRPVEVPVNLYGQHILGSPMNTVFSESGLDETFNVYGSYAVIEGLRFFGKTDGAPPNSLVRIKVQADAYKLLLRNIIEFTPDTAPMGGTSIACVGAPQELRIYDCELEEGINLAAASKALISGNTFGSLNASANSSELRITDNRITDTGASLNGTARSVISGNIFRGNLSIFGGAAALDNVISDNAMSNNAITTSSSGGNNTITGNTEVSTLTSHGTDAVGNNT